MRFPLVGLVALVSAGLGFMAGAFVGYGRRPATPAAAPAPVVQPAPPRAEPVVAPAPTVATAPVAAPESQVPAAPVAPPAPRPDAQVVSGEPAAAPVTAPKEAQEPTLKQIVVPYKALEGQSQRIIIPVRFNDRVTAEMALDTGAPETVIFAPLAVRLGLTEEGSNRLMTYVGGLGGRAPAMLVILDSLSVDEARTEFVPATVTASMTGAFEGLVGMDFLAGYQVRIDTQKHELVLTELPESSARPAGHDEAWWRHIFTQLRDQQTYWREAHATMKERTSMVSGGRSADVLRFTERQASEAELLASRLERFASNHAVPREWRRE